MRKIAFLLSVLIPAISLCQVVGDLRFDTNIKYVRGPKIESFHPELVHVTSFSQNAKKIIDEINSLERGVPPGGPEIIKWFWTGYPKTYKGWGIESKEIEKRGWSGSGRLFLYQVSVSCDTCGAYLPKYVYDVYFEYRDGGDADLAEDGLKVYQNKDSTILYAKRAYDKLK